MLLGIIIYNIIYIDKGHLSSVKPHIIQLNVQGIRVFWSLGKDVELITKTCVSHHLNILYGLVAEKTPG